jgi:hypothetical protein
MRSNRIILVFVWLAACVSTHGQAGRNAPHVAYLSPAGARVGTTVEILAGGQNFGKLNAVRVSGDGVEARIIKTYRPLRNLDQEQRALLQWRIASRRTQLEGSPAPPKPVPPKPAADGTPAPEVVLPDIPLLDLLDTMDQRTLRHWMTIFQRRDRMQKNSQLAETARVEIKVAANARPGMREIRFSGPQGLSNPLRFEIGTLTEIPEFEPNEPISDAKLPAGPAASLPCCFNGQIQSGDVDQFRFHARRGQNLVIRGQARALIPYLADAVPGWFQMTVTMRDAKGREVAYGDDFRFDPDPVFCCRIPDDGDYLLEVRDSIFRGRDDFVYRISVGELPFVTSAFPLGSREGVPSETAVSGWNLPAARMELDTSIGGRPVRSTRMSGGCCFSNDVPYAIDSLPEITETGSNNDSASASVVPFPCVINGRIEKSGDADVFRIDGRKGAELLVEVIARRLRSPLDSVVHVGDESGATLAWNDDSMEKDGTLHLGDGLLTHYADSRVRLKIPSNGPLFVRIADAQSHGGPEYAYRLRISEACPDFELRVTPSVANLPPGANVPLCVHVLRNDGFAGEVRLGLHGTPPGFVLSGGRIPAGSSQVRVTLSIPPRTAAGLFSPRLTGTADGPGGKTITRTAVAADDVMQAFLWRHLVPSDEWLICIPPARGNRPPVDLDCPLPLRVPVGGSAEVRINLQKWIASQPLELELSEAPCGISLSPVRKCHGGVAFDVTADAATAKAGLETNLIVDVFADRMKNKKNGPGAKNTQRFPIAGLPAIPIILTPPKTP